MSLTLSSIYRRCACRNGCRIWLHAISGCGYPFIYDSSLHRPGDKGQKCMVPGRRAVWALHHGKPVPAGLVTITSCRERLCLEKTHIQAVTQAEARAFAAAAGAWQSVACKVSRAANARRNAKFSLEQAENIRQRVKGGETRLSVAKDLGADRNLIDKIVSGDRYVLRVAPNSSVWSMST